VVCGIVSTADEWDQSQECKLALRREAERLIEIHNLAIVQENEEAIAFKGSDGFCELLLGIQNGAGPDSVEDSLGFFRLDEALEHFVIRLVEPGDFLVDAEPNDLAERQTSFIELKYSRASAFAGRGLVAYGQFERHTSLSDRL
jgi:hypothetical protein